MDAVIIFSCLFLPTFWLNLMSAGRDQLLFQERVPTKLTLTVVAVILAVVVLLALGMSLSWALALALPGPLGSRLGQWAASGGPTVLRFRLLGR